MKKMFKTLIVLAIATLASCISPNTNKSTTPPTTPIYNNADDVPTIMLGSEGVEYTTTMPA